ncbi:MAG: hypothetical protein PHW96_02260 [Candidatus Nanoarchaeia archaeon]|nr:hypothetical protein [Candidatus Nanoarchaeia archaeon]
MEEVTIPVIGGYLVYFIFGFLVLAIVGKFKSIKEKSGLKEKIIAVFDVVGCAVLVLFLIQYYNYYEFGVANDALLFIAVIAFLVPNLESLIRFKGFKR